jgi:site-specific DNA-methyltransferase (adenine-specific)
MNELNKPYAKVLEGDCLAYLDDSSVKNIHLTYFDPPYLQGKNYRHFDDNESEEKYWTWVKEILSKTYNVTVEGGAIYFMQREKNSEQVLKMLRETNWTFQNLIIWKKKTSAVPSNIRFSKQYQIIVFATKGKKPRVFNKLRIDYPLSPNHKYPRKN